MKRNVLMFEEDEIKTVTIVIHTSLIDLQEIPDCYAKNHIRQKLHEALNILYSDEVGEETTDDA